MSSHHVTEYMDFVDELASMANCVTGQRVRSGEPVFTGTTDNDRFNQVLSRLGAEERVVIADLLDLSRSSGIHDTLSLIESGEYQLSHRGIKLAHQPFGTELFFDFIARKEGDPWPDQA